jgi:hypothetical protein
MDPFNSFETPDWAQFDLEPLAPCTVENGHPFPTLSPHQPPTNLVCPPLSPPELPEYPPTPSTQPPPTPNLPPAGCSSDAPPRATLPQTTPPQTTPPQTPLPQTTPPPPPPPSALKKFLKFDFCPYTRHGQICRYVSWACSSNKQIKRHMKADHFPDVSLGYECPNPRCNYKYYRFLRKDACVEHRRACDFVQGPGYTPLPTIISGSDAEVDRWMRARCKQKREIVKMLKDGTPWSADLLEPVSI